MNKIKIRVILRDNNKGKIYEMKGMEEGYDSQVLDFTRICAKSWESVTSQHIDWC